MNSADPVRRQAVRGGWNRYLFAAAALALVPIMLGSCSRPAKSVTWCREGPDRPSCLAAACGSHDRTMAVFAATWCPACQQFGKTLMDGDVQKRLQAYGTVWIDTDENGALSEKHEIESIPTVIFFDRQCRPMARFTGAPPPELLLRLLDTVDSLKATGAD